MAGELVCGIPICKHIRWWPALDTLGTHHALQPRPLLVPPAPLTDGPAGTAPAVMLLLMPSATCIPPPPPPPPPHPHTESVWLT